MINIRKLAAVDMALNGTRFIVAEFAIGIVFPLTLGLLSVRSGLLSPNPTNWQTFLGFWLASIAVNYAPFSSTPS